jgi:hypothetical protein
LSLIASTNVVSDLRERKREKKGGGLAVFPSRLVLLMGSVPGYLKLLQNGLQAPPLWPLLWADFILGKGMGPPG